MRPPTYETIGASRGIAPGACCTTHELVRLGADALASFGLTIPDFPPRLPRRTLRADVVSSRFLL